MSYLQCTQSEEYSHGCAAANTGRMTWWGRSETAAPETELQALIDTKAEDRSHGTDFATKALVLLRSATPCYFIDRTLLLPFDATLFVQICTPGSVNNLR